MGISSIRLAPLDDIGISRDLLDEKHQSSAWMEAIAFAA
jgi:hypothetical protein